MKFLLTVLLLATATGMRAQNIVDVKTTSTTSLSPGAYYTVSGVPFVNTKYVNLVEGSPYLFDNWRLGYFIGIDGRRFKNEQVRIDLLQNQLHFMDNNGLDMLCDLRIKEMWLEDSTSTVLHHFVRASDMPETMDRVAWYEVLEAGRVSLLKAYFKLLSEVLPYGSATHEQRIYTKERFYLLKDSKLIQVKGVRDIMNLLVDKRTALEAFQKKQSATKVPEHSIAAIVRYYLSLFDE